MGGANIFSDLPTNSFIASSFYNYSLQPAFSRLETQQQPENPENQENTEESDNGESADSSEELGWLPAAQSTDDWLDVDLDRPKLIKYVTIVPGERDEDEGVYLVLHKLGCSLDGKKYIMFQVSTLQLQVSKGNPVRWWFCN